MNDSVGSFIWYELMTPDIDAAAKFYGSFLGWTMGTRTATNADDKDYRMITRGDGGFAGGVLALTPEMLTKGARPSWLMYLMVSDVDATLSAITADGGKTLMPPMDLPVGRIALVTDPMGTPFYVMKPIPPPDKPDARSDVFDPLALDRVNWNELASSDQQRAKSFYAKHFRFEFKESMSMGPLGDYCFISHGELPMVGAVMQAPEGAPANGWLFYFSVTSVDAARKAIEQRGGRVMIGPHDVPGGRFILIATDPHGAAFGVVGPSGV